MKRASGAGGPPLEAKVTKLIMAFLKKQPGVWCFKVAGGPMQQRGVPDIICSVNGAFVALEVKRPGIGRLTDLQALTIERIREAGGVAEVVTSVGEAAAVIDGLAPVAEPAEEPAGICGPTCRHWGKGSVPSECYDPCAQCRYDQGYLNWEPMVKKEARL